MKRIACFFLAVLLALSVATDAFGWGSVSGPRGGAAYRGPMGGGAVRGPNGGAAVRGPLGSGAAVGPNGGATPQPGRGLAVSPFVVPMAGPPCGVRMVPLLCVAGTTGHMCARPITAPLSPA